MAPTISAPARTWAEALTSCIAAEIARTRSSGSPRSGRSTNTVEMRLPSSPRSLLGAHRDRHERDGLARARRRPGSRTASARRCASSTSLTVAPVARRTALTSSSRAAREREEPLAPDLGVQPRVGRRRAHPRQLADHLGRAPHLARVRAAGRVRAARPPRARACAARELGRGDPGELLSRASAARLRRRLGSGGGSSSRSGVGSRITVLTSTAAMPSTSAWCIFATAPCARPRGPRRPSAATAAASGRAAPTSAGPRARRARRRRRARAGAARRRGLGVEAGSSTQTGLASPSGASSSRIGSAGSGGCARGGARRPSRARPARRSTSTPPTCMWTGPRSAWMAERSEGESGSATRRSLCGGQGRGGGGRELALRWP